MFDSTCDCPNVGEIFTQDYLCKCPNNQVLLPPTEDSSGREVCGCESNFILDSVSQHCQCPIHTTFYDDVNDCVCDDLNKLKNVDDNKCYCLDGLLTDTDGECTCPPDQTIVDGVCVCISGEHFIYDSVGNAQLDENGWKQCFIPPTCPEPRVFFPPELHDPEKGLYDADCICYDELDREYFEPFEE